MITSSSILIAVLFYGILTLWVPAQWPLAAFHIGTFSLCALSLLKPVNVSNLPFAALSLVTLWGVAQVFLHQTVGPLDTATAALSWAALLALFFAAHSMFEDARTRALVRRAMLLFAFVVSVEATLQAFTSGGKVLWVFPTEYTEAVMGPILYRNHYAAWIELLLPIALFEAFASRRSRLLYAMMAASMYASVIASGSRTGAILCTAELLLVPLLITVRKIAPGRIVASAMAQISAVMACFTAIVGWQVIWNRLIEPNPYSVRRELVDACLGMIRDRPWLGWGLGTWTTVYPAYATIDTGAFANRAHNDWLEWAAEGGIPFALLLLVFAICSIRPAFRTIWGLGAISVFLHATVDYPFSRPQLAAWTIVVIAMLTAADKGADAVSCHVP